MAPRTLLTILLLAASAPLTAPAWAQAAPPRPASPETSLSWTDWADLALASPVIVRTTVTRVDRLSRRDAPDVPPGEVRAIVESALTAAIRAPAILPAGAAWRWQGPADARGRPPLAKGADMLVFGHPLSGGGDPAIQPLRLSAPDAMRPWSAEAEAIVRDVLRQAQAPGAAGLAVTGLKDGFRTEGDVPGTSESQFFLPTARGGVLTLLVRREPGVKPQLLAASGDLVDRAAPVAPRTLLWRALACGMPAALPPALAADPKLAEDWAFARRAIGACGRTRPLPG